MLGIPARIVRVMLGCPSDVEDLKKIVFEEVWEWNQDHAEDMEAALIPKHWKTHTRPQLQLDGRTQDLVNKQLTDFADILVAIFRHKLGSDTGKAASGTVEEIREFLKSGRPILLYFSQESSLDASTATDPDFVEEYRRLQDFREEAKKLGLYSPFESPDDFRKKFKAHLMREIRDLKRKGDLSTESDAAHQIQLEPQQQKSLIILQRTVKQLYYGWKAEAESTLSKYESGKHLMRQLNKALTSHLPELDELYSEEELEDLMSFFRHIKSIEQALPMGRDFRKQFWGTGSEIFRELLDTIETLKSNQ